MPISKRHQILVATDGSPSAEAALLAAVRFPWGRSARARAVVGRSEWLRPDSDETRAVLAQSYKVIADAARRALSARWPKPEVTIVGKPPAEAILTEAHRTKTTLILLGWRGHGRFKRVLAGSVARTVAAHAKCPVLVVREAPRTIRRFVVGYDGCPNAERALDLMCSFEAPSGSQVIVVNVAEPVSLPASVSLLPPAARAQLRQEVKALKEQRFKKAQEVVDAGVARLNRCGWSAKGEMRIGAPLERLLSAVDDHRPDVLVLGARAVSGLERMLLGSVANGALNRSRVPVLLAR